MKCNNIKLIGIACTGCRACEQGCPKKCITITPNQEGFLYPLVDEKSCVNCGICLKKCAQSSSEQRKSTPLHFYSFKNKNQQEIFNSASGGVSDVATKIILAQGGVAFGASYTANLSVEHIAISNNERRYKLQSSKYVQSDLNNCYTQAKGLLNNGRIVLFTGTPCQIDGVKCFLGREYENFFTIDLICHGVPSPLFFKKYTEYMGRKMGGELVEYNFRSKIKKGWGTQYLAKTRTRAKTGILSLDKYGKHFVDGDCYRECCYQCRYADIKKRPGDLTIGDFWAVDKFYPKINSKLGVSSVIVNTEKGNRLIELMKNYAEIAPIKLEAVLVKQGNLEHPTGRPLNRDSFYKDINQDDFISKMPIGIQIENRIKLLLPRRAVITLKKFFRI